MSVVYFFHVLGATVWIGGLIVMGAMVSAVRGATKDRTVIQAMAKRFGVISWTALGLLVVTGGVLAIDNWSQTLIVKLGLVMLVAMLAAFHTVMAGEQSPAMRGAVQGLILILSLAILAVATTLNHS